MANLRRLVIAAALLGWFIGAAAAQKKPPIYKPGESGATAPMLVKETKAHYTDEARAKGIQGIVELEAVVLEDGTVGDVTVTRSLDDKYGLDQAAVDAMKEWVFKPGQKDGKAVRVAVTVEMSFTLK